MVTLGTLKLFKIFLLKRIRVNLWIGYNDFDSWSLLSSYKYLLCEWVTHLYIICAMCQDLWGLLSCIIFLNGRYN